MSVDNYFDSEKAYKEAVAKAGTGKAQRLCKPVVVGSIPAPGSRQEEKIEYTFTRSQNLTCSNQVYCTGTGYDMSDFDHMPKGEEDDDDSGKRLIYIPPNFIIPY